MKTIEQIQQETEDTIARVGWTVMAVFASDDFQNDGTGGTPSFAYTVGLADKGLPELIVFSFKPQHAQTLLNVTAQRMIKHGVPPLDTELNDMFEEAVAMVIEAERSKADNFMCACTRRTPGYRALQIVWQDPDHFFPWEAGYDVENFGQLQPILRTEH